MVLYINHNNFSLSIVNENYITHDYNCNNAVHITSMRCHKVLFTVLNMNFVSVNYIINFTKKGFSIIESGKKLKVRKKNKEDLREDQESKPINKHFDL